MQKRCEMNRQIYRQHSSTKLCTDVTRHTACVDTNYQQRDRQTHTHTHTHT